MPPRGPGNPPTLPLTRHPHCAPGAVHAIGVRVARAAASLTLRFRLDGAVDGIAVPPRRPPERRDGLWRHTCLEVFVRERGAAAYAEFNSSPSGAWAAYRFEAYRAGRRDLELERAPAVSAVRHGAWLELAMVIAHMPQPWASADAVVVGVSAVIEEADGALSYWGLAHPAGAPDFHHPAGHALELRATPPAAAGAGSAVTARRGPRRA